MGGNRGEKLKAVVQAKQMENQTRGKNFIKVLKWASPAQSRHLALVTALWDFIFTPTAVVHVDWTFLLLFYKNRHMHICPLSARTDCSTDTACMSKRKISTNSADRQGCSLNIQAIKAKVHKVYKLICHYYLHVYGEEGQTLKITVVRDAFCILLLRNVHIYPFAMLILSNFTTWVNSVFAEILRQLLEYGICIKLWDKPLASKKYRRVPLVLTFWLSAKWTCNVIKQ